jgi:hypothetical protein
MTYHAQQPWRRSPYCDSAACVEVAVTGDRVYVRNSAAPESVLSFTHEEWHVFVRGLRDGARD